MSRCYACNLLMSEAVEIEDKPTGRFYCTACFEFTVDEMLRNLEREDEAMRNDPRKRFMETGEVETIYPELIDHEGNILDIEYFDDLIGQDIIVIKLNKMVDLSPDSQNYPGQRMTTNFEWGEVKDYVIPFVAQVNKNYTFNTKWYDDGGSITVCVWRNCRAFTYDKFMKVIDKWYQDDEEVRYFEIILDNK